MVPEGAGGDRATARDAGGPVHCGDDATERGGGSLRATEATGRERHAEEVRAICDGSCGGDRRHAAATGAGIERSGVGYLGAVAGAGGPGGRRMAEAGA